MLNLIKPAKGLLKLTSAALSSAQGGTGRQPALGECVHHAWGLLAVPTHSPFTERKQITLALLRLQKKMIFLVNYKFEINYFEVTKDFKFTLTTNTYFMVKKPCTHETIGVFLNKNYIYFIYHFIGNFLLGGHGGACL